MSEPLPSPTHDNAAYVHAVHDRGLAFDLGVMSRRRMLTYTSLGAAAWVTSGLPSARAADTPAVGPARGDDVRTASGIVRSDIRSSIGAGGATAHGVALTFSIAVCERDRGPLEGAAVYAWHCDRLGRYSLYSTGLTEENYLRGIQPTGPDGRATFTSIFPGSYPGRWPHIHLEIYDTLAQATSGSGRIRASSQLALPQDVATCVYRQAEGYDGSLDRLAQVTIASDPRFGPNDAATSMSTVTGSIARGYTAALTVLV